MSMSPWESVRRVGRPAWRRAALWLTAWQVIPHLPLRLRPTTVPEEYLTDIDTWWIGARGGMHLAKLMRIYVSLRRARQVFDE